MNRNEKGDRTYRVKLADLEPIHSPEAEQAVLGAMLCGGEDLLCDITLKLKREDFFNPGNGLLFDAMVDMWGEGIEIEPSTVFQYLEDRRLADAIGGGAGLLGELATSVISTLTAPTHVETVRNKSLLRQLQQVSARSIVAADEMQHDVAAVMAEADRSVSRVVDRWMDKGGVDGGETFKTLKDCMLDFADESEQMMGKKNEFSGIPTGFYQLDLLLKGLQPSEYVVIAAEPGLGKTAFILNMMLAQATKKKDADTGQWVSPGYPVGFFSVEMNHAQLSKRMVALQSGIVSGKVRTPQGWKQDDLDKVLHTAGELGDLPIYINDDGMLTPEKLAARARWMVRKYGVEIFYVDYLQIMTLSERVSHGDPETVTTQECSNAIRRTAKALGVPFVVLCQFNKEGLKGSPSMHNIKGSGQIIQDAHTIILLTDHTPKDWQPGQPKVIKATIHKAREAEKGTYRFFDYDGPVYKFNQQQSSVGQGGGITDGKQGRSFK